MPENMDPINDDDTDGSFIMLTPSKKPWPNDLKLKVYDFDNFFTAMSSFHCFRRLGSNSKGTQFSAIEKIPSGMLQSTESQTENQKTPDLTPTHQQSQSRDTGVSLEEGTRAENINENSKYAGIAEETKREFRDCGVQANMEQTGVVRPVVRDTEPSRIPQESDFGDNKNRNNNDVNNIDETTGKIYQKFTFFGDRLGKLQNLAKNVARDMPSRKLTLLEDYLDSIRELWQMVATEDMEKLKSFVKDEEQKLSSSLYWEWTNESDIKGHKCETAATEYERADWKSNKESNTKGHNVRRETSDREQTGTGQSTSRNPKFSSYHPGRDQAAHRRVENSRSANHHSSHKAMHNSESRRNDDDTKRSTMRNPSNKNAWRSRPMRSGSMDAKSRPGSISRILKRVSERRPSRRPDLDRRMDDIEDKFLPNDDSILHDDINDSTKHWSKPFQLVEEGLPPNRNNRNPSGSPSIDDLVVHGVEGRRVSDGIDRNEVSATSRINLQSERDPRRRKRPMRGGIDQTKRSRRDHLYPRRISDHFDGGGSFDSSHNNDPHEGDLRKLIPKYSNKTT